MDREAELMLREIDGVIELPLDEALAMCRRWAVEDANNKENGQ